MPLTGPVAVLMHMHRCPSARSGVAKRKGVLQGGASPGLHKPVLRRGRWGTPCKTAPLYPCVAQGGSAPKDVGTKQRTVCKAHGAFTSGFIDADGGNNGPRPAKPRQRTRFRGLTLALALRYGRGARVTRRDRGAVFPPFSRNKKRRGRLPSGATLSPEGLSVQSRPRSAKLNTCAPATMK